MESILGSLFWESSICGKYKETYGGYLRESPRIGFKNSHFSADKTCCSFPPCLSGVQ